MASCADELVPLRHGCSVEKLLNPAREDDILQTIPDDVLVATETTDDAPEKEEKIDSANDGELFPFINEHLHVLSLIKKVAASRATENSGF